MSAVVTVAVSAAVLIAVAASKRMNLMKISKRQLRRIIQEEKASLLEQRSVEFEFVQAVDSVMAILKSLDPMERNPMIYDLVEELEDLASRG